MTVLQIIPTLDAGGAERTTVDVTRALVRQGNRALVVSEGGRLAKDIEAAGGVLFNLPVASKSPIQIISNIFQLKKIIQEHNVSIVHARSRAPAWSAFLASRQCGVPFVTTYHGTYSGRTYLKRLYNSIMVRGERVIANSKFIAGHIRDTYGLSPDKIITIPRGLDVEVFDPNRVSPQEIADLRAQWEVPDPNTAIILLPGRLTSWKGQGVLIEAAHRLREKGYTDFVCILMGDAQGRTGYERSLRHLITSHDLEQVVKIVPHTRNMPAAYELADVVISSSTRPEAFGRIAIEAQAMKRPVIVTDHGGAQETVLNEKTGWRVLPGDADAMARAIVRTLQLDIHEREAICERARQRVLRHYSVDVMCQNTLNLYSSLVGSKISQARG